MTNGSVKHGDYGTPLYKVWAGMKRRCLNKRDMKFKYYGGRGITLCHEWMTYEGFKSDMGCSFREGLKLDRKDNESGYNKKNCHWISHSENCRNRRSNRKITFQGETHCLKEWSEISGVRYKTLHARLKRGWSFGKAIKI